MIIALAGVSLPIYFTGLVALPIFVHKLDWFDVQYVRFKRDSGRAGSAT